MTRKFPHFLPICSSTIAKSVLPVKLRQLWSGAALTNYTVQLSVSKLTGYEPDGRGSIPWHQQALFSSAPRLDRLVPTKPPIQWTRRG
jgi:hypothetical protein